MTPTYEDLKRALRKGDCYCGMGINNPMVTSHSAICKALRDQDARSKLRWRVGGQQPHNIYCDDVHVAVALGEPKKAAIMAQRIVDAMNYANVPEID